MGRVVIGVYMVRYPLGGVLSSSLQWIVGLRQLGHDVFVLEKAGWPDSCFDPARDVMSDNCDYGTRAVNDLLSRFGLGDQWCYVDASGSHHGLSPSAVRQVLDSADVFIDRGTHAAWLDDLADSTLRVLIDGEPGSRQMKLELQREADEALPRYDFSFTVGRNVGTEESSAPTAGITWRPIFHPVVLDLYPAAEDQPHNGAFTTVMNWQAHDELEFRGTVYGQKDVEFERFMTLPELADVPIEIAVSGLDVPTGRLRESGWRIRDAHEVTITYDGYGDYIRASTGEFSVAKNVFVATNSAWFSDRSAAYLASGRPVVLQETGFSRHLPCGEGLFAVRDVAEAAAAIREIAVDYPRHSRGAREIAMEYLDARKVVGGVLSEVGLD